MLELRLIARHFHDEIKRSLNLDRDLGAGCHIVRDQERRIVRRFIIRYLWFVEVAFPQGCSYCVAVIKEEDRHSVFCLRYFNKSIDITEKIDFVPNWEDPVAEFFSNLDLWDLNTGVPLDSISYTLSGSTLNTKFGIQFSSSTKTATVGLLEKAVLEVLEQIRKESSMVFIKQFIEEWKTMLDLRNS